MVDHDRNTGALASQLYDAWNSRAPASVYAGLRDELLTQHEHIDTRIATLVTVVNIACPSIATTERYFDPKWDRLFNLAISIDSDDEAENSASLGKRKRTCNEAIRTRNLAVVASLWSPQVVKHYGWNAAAQGLVKLLRACAVRYPHFKKEFCPRLNCVLLHRHQEAIQFGRRKTLNEAPLQAQCDLDIAALQSVSPDAEYEELWIASSDGSVPLHSDGTLLKDLRPYHFHHYLLQRDRYGMLIARERSTTLLDPATGSASAAIASLSSEVTPPGGPYAPNWMDVSYYDNPLHNSFTSEEATVCPLALYKIHPVEFEICGVNVGTIGISSGLEHFTSNPSTQDPDQIRFVTSPALEEATTLDANCNGKTFDEHSISGTTQEQSQNMSPECTVNPSTYGESRSVVDKACKILKRQRGESSRRRGKRVVTDAVELHAVRNTVGLVKPAIIAPAGQSRSEASLTLDAPLLEGISANTLEENLHRKHHEVLMSYLKKLSDPSFAGFDGDRRRLRTQWFTPKTKLARVWTSEDFGLPSGSAASEEDAEVFYYSSDKFIIDVQAGKIFRKPVVIKESFSDTGMHTAHAIASIIEDTSGVARLEVQDLDTRAPISMEATKFSSSLRTCTDEGLHTLNLRNLTKAHKPIFTMMRRFRLLDSLTERLYHNPATGSSSVNVASCVSFNIAALAGAFSGPYVDAVSGTWVRILDGVKFWMVVPEHDMNSEWENFVKTRDTWTPKEKQRLVILEKDDIVFIPPGLRILHAAHSPGRSVIEGGMFWDELDYPSTLAGIQWTCESQRITNERFAFRLPRIIPGLEELVMEQPGRFCRNAPRDKVRELFHHAFKAISDLQCLCGTAKGDHACSCV